MNSAMSTRPALRSRLPVLLALSAFLLSACGLFVSPDKHVERAKEHLAKTEYNAAMAQLKTALEDDPNHVPARLMLAEVHLQLGDLPSAEKELKRAEQAGAPTPQLRDLRYRILAAGRRIDDLARELESDTETGPPHRLVLESIVLSARGDLDGAEQKVRAALQDAPGDAEATIELARLLAGRGHADEAITLLHGVKGAQAMQARAQFMEGTLMLTRGQYQVGRELLASANDKARGQLPMPDQIAIAVALTEANLALNDVAAASTSLETVRKRVPESLAAHYLAARLAMLKNDPQTAIAECNRLLTKMPDYAPARLLLGAAHLSRGSFEQAEAALSPLIAQQPDNVAARKLMAQVYLGRNQPAKAQQMLAAVNANGNADPQLDWIMGAALLQTGDVGGLSRLERSVTATPDDGQKRITLARAYLAANQPDKAAEVLKGLPANSPQQSQAQSLVVLASVAGKPPAVARREIDALVEKHPKDVSMLATAGVYLASIGDATRSKELLDRAVALDATANDARFALASLAARSGDMPGAESQLQAIIKTDPKQQQARVGMAELAWLRGDRDSARKWLEDAIGADPGAVDARVRLAQLAFVQGDAPRGRDLLNQAVGVATDKQMALNSAGQVLARAGLADEALAKFSEASAAGSTEGTLNAARLHLEANRRSEARQLAESVPSESPRRADAQRLLIELEARDGKIESALARARALARKDATAADLREVDGDVYSIAQRRDAARDAYADAYRQVATGQRAVKIFQMRRALNEQQPERTLTEWLKRSPRDATSRRLLAAFYESVGRREDAQAEYERLLADEQIDPISLNNLAWLLHERGDARAVELAKKAYFGAPGVGEIADTYGWILVQTNKVPEGLTVLERALAAAPANPDIQYHAASAYARAGQRDRARQLLEQALHTESKVAWRDDAAKLLESVKAQGSAN
jgi:putative PEP-CTERM system TPR-repeat lipoprotein